MTASAPDGDTIRLVLIDDHPLVHDAIESWCAATAPPIAIASSYSDPDTFVSDRLGRLSSGADVVVLDLQFDQQRPDLGALRTMCDRGYRVIVYSQHAQPELVLECLDIGAVTYLSKAEGREHMIAAVRAATSDRPYVSPTMARAISADPDPDRPRLSNREREVLLNWFRTESKAFVAQQLYVSVGTVNTHLERIRAKYAAAGRPAATKAALVARAIQDGLITADEI